MKSWRKWLKRILWTAAALVAVSVPTTYFGGKWAVRKYLGRGIAVGQGSLRVVNARWHWNFALAADSLYYTAPNLRVAAGSFRVSANLFRSLFRFSPLVDAALDTARLTLLPAASAPAQSVHPDSLAFPDVKIPVSIRATARGVFVDDDSGFLASAVNVRVLTAGSQSAKLDVGKIRARPLHALSLGLHAGVDWFQREAKADVEVKCGADQISMSGKFPKTNLLRGSADVHVQAASSKPYVAALLPRLKWPTVGHLDFTAQVSSGRGYRAQVHLQAVVSGFDPSAPYRLSPQRVFFRFDFRDSAGQWLLTSRGSRGEDIGFQGNLHATAADSLKNPGWLFHHVKGTLSGHVHGIPLVVDGRKIAGDAEVNAPQFNPNAADVKITTGDGSRIFADLRNKAGRGWAGAFSARVVPAERWVRAFCDTNVAFRSLITNGRVENNALNATLDAGGLTAYGAAADSLHLILRSRNSAYELEPSFLRSGKTTWQLAGRLQTGKTGTSATLRLWNPAFGSVQADMPKAGLLKARITRLMPEKLPYRGLKKLAAYHPRLTLDFQWDRAAQTGAADVDLAGVYDKEKADFKTRAHWNKDALEVPELIASIGGASLRAGLALKLEGRPFYEVTKLSRKDYRLVYLEANQFDLAKALRIVLPNPPLLSGVVDGRLSYSDSAGFHGAYRFRNVQPAATADMASIHALSLAGTGDSLVITAVTVSKKEPLFDDSAVIALGGVLSPNQSLAVRVEAGQSLFIRFTSRMHAFQDVQGELDVKGGGALPGKTGEILNLRARAGIGMTFKDGLKSLVLQMDTLQGQYAIPGLDTETFSGPMKIRDGRLKVPALSLKGRTGDLNGRVEYGLTGARVLSAHVEGGGFIAQLGPDDKVQLRNLGVDVKADSNLITLQAHVGAGSAEHVQPPLRVAADFSRLAVFYRAPAGKPAANGPDDVQPLLKVIATLDSSTIRYKLQSFEALQNLFKRSRATRSRARRPMQMQINVETSGSGNKIETDIFRMTYVGNFSMRGVYPYALVDGRINSTQGELGAKGQSYDITRLEVKWLNSTLEEGEVDMEATKKLARNCEAGTTDSCTVISKLSGQLSQVQFSYDTDCGGAYGSGADVAALIYSVRRGCYSTAFATSATRTSYQEQALALLEPLASDYLSEAAGRLSGHWIAQTQISGLGALSSGKQTAADTGTANEAVSLEVDSKEFWRTRLRLRSYYRPNETETNNPWAYLVSVIWRPPLERYVRNSEWKRRVKNNISTDATLYTDTAGNVQQNQQQVGFRFGLNYNFDFWGSPWTKKRPAGNPGAKKPVAADSTQ